MNHRNPEDIQGQKKGAGAERDGLRAGVIGAAIEVHRGKRPMTSKAERIPPRASTHGAPRRSLLHMSKSRSAAATPLPVDPVIAGLQAPVVQTMSPERRAILEEDLRAMAASGAPDNLLRQAIEERLRQEAEMDAHPMTAEEEDEIERMIAETDEDLRAGRCIPAEVFCAERGIPWHARTG